MIGKISKGSDFHGLLAYLLKQGRGEVLDMINLSSTDPSDAAGEMSLAAMLSRRVHRPVLHCSISYGPGEAPTEDQMRADGRAALKSLGLEGNQAILVRHRDRDHIHFHIAANRVSSDGRAVHDSKSFAKLEATLRDIEGRRGWRLIAARNAPDPDGQRFRGAASRPDPRQVAVPAPVRAALLEAKTWKELHQRLQAEGWRLEAKARPGQKSGALLLGPRGEKIGAGKVDRNVTLSRLQARLSERSQALGGHSTKKKGRREPAAVMLAALAEGLLAPALGFSNLGQRRRASFVGTTARKSRLHLRRLLHHPGLNGPSM